VTRRIDDMKIEFRKTSARTYAIKILRDGAAPLEMDPAPGYDDAMPHDLLHLVVEVELGLHLGVFGQVAAGGTAQTFHERDRTGRRRREASRERRKLARRGDKLAKAGRDEAALSERATFLCLNAWLARSREPELRARASRLTDEVAHVDAVQTSDDSRALTPQAMNRICARLDELSARWRRLGIGESLAVDWSSR